MERTWPATELAPRLPVIDAARGLAIAAMAIYHFSWDLRYFGFIAADVEGGLGWRIFARLIAATFLFLVGVSLVLAARRGFRLEPYVRRLGVLALAAAAITLATLFAFPQTYIFFGILHCIAASTMLGLAFLRAPLWVVAAAAVACLAAPALLSGGVFNAPALLWLGLPDTFPRTNDYVPILPWFGVVLAGTAAARLLPNLPTVGRVLALKAPWPFVWAGRRSLAIYLIHQPLLFGLVYGAAQIAPPPRDAMFLQSCTASCAGAALSGEVCGRICGCLVERSQADGLWDHILKDALTDEERVRYFDHAELCRAREAP